MGRVEADGRVRRVGQQVSHHHGRAQLVDEGLPVVAQTSRRGRGKEVRLLRIEI